VLTVAAGQRYFAVHFLLLKVLSSAGMGLTLKHADQRGVERIPLIRVNYAVAAVLAFLAAVAMHQTHVSRPTALLAVVTGVLFVAGLLVWSRAIQAAGLALSVVAMRTSVVIPVLASVVFWRESASALELAGSGLALLALGLVLSGLRRSRASGASSSTSPGLLNPKPEIQNPKPSPRTVPPWLWLSLLFLVDGLVMVPAQVFSRLLPQDENLPFQALLFVSAFAVTTLLYYVSRQRVTRRSLELGSLLGACNLGNYVFLVLALAVLPGVVVYPVIAAAEVVLMALAGAVLWRERVGVRSWVGIGLAVLALVLVQLGRAV